MSAACNLPVSLKASMTWIGLVNNEPASGYPHTEIVYICVSIGLGLVGAVIFMFIFNIALYFVGGNSKKLPLDALTCLKCSASLHSNGGDFFGGLYHVLEGISCDPNRKSPAPHTFKPRH